MRVQPWLRSDLTNKPQVGVSMPLATLAYIMAAVLIYTPVGADVGKSSVKVTTTNHSFLPGLRGVRLFDTTNQDQQISEEMVVRILYRSLQEATAASGKPVIFELDGFSTLYPDDFSRVRWSEIVTQQGGRHLRIERIETHDQRGPLGVSYEPSWTTIASEQPSELQKLTHGLSVGRLFSKLALQDYNLSNVVAATRYHVKVSFEGISRSYTAAVLWLDPDRNGVVTMAVQDNVTDRVDEAIIERFRVAPRTTLGQQFRAATSASGDGIFQSSTTSTTSCNPHDATYSFPQSTELERTGHNTGYHTASVRFDYACHCDSTCRSTCLPELTDTRCFETGTLSGPPGTHKTRTSQKIVNGSKPDAGYTGADCGAGWACYIQYCPSNVCSGFTIETSAQPLDVGIGVTFNASSQAVWDGQQDFPFQCDGCRVGEAGDADPTTPPPDYQQYEPAGGYGWYPSCYWGCTSYWNSTTNTYYEECTVHC